MAILRFTCVWLLACGHNKINQSTYTPAGQRAAHRRLTCVTPSPAFSADAVLAHYLWRILGVVPTVLPARASQPPPARDVREVGCGMARAFLIRGGRAPLPAVLRRPMHASTSLLAVVALPVATAQKIPHRLAYNRVGKTGSTTLTHLLQHMGDVHRFRVWDVSPEGYSPNASMYAQQLRGVPDRGVYINHAQHLLAAPADYGWINIVREPIERWASYYYYRVDGRPGIQPTGWAEQELAARAADTRCGCYALEFDACIRLRAERNCSYLMGGLRQMDEFCAVDGVCTLSEAIQNLKQRYLVVGLYEELELSIRGFEKLLPTFFKGATNIYLAGEKRSRVTSEFNPLTNTSMTGCISNTARNIIREKWKHLQEELEFYEVAKRLFWNKMISSGVPLL